LIWISIQGAHFRKIVGQRTRFGGRTLAPSSFSYLFCGDTDEARELHRLAARIVVPAGKIIFLENEPADSVFGLSKGTARLFKLMADGRRQIVSLALPGEFLEMPTVDQHGYSAAAIGEVELCRFPRNPLLGRIRSSPKLMGVLVDFLTRQLNLAQDQLVMLGKRSAEERVLLFLAAWRDRIIALKPLQQYLPLPMLREDIADLLGLTIETISRTLSGLEKKKVIRVVPKGVILTGLEQALPGSLADGHAVKRKAPEPGFWSRVE
jgi:CRP/FNR family transcriptional regulator, anaerobic regulatory protein